MIHVYSQKYSAALSYILDILFAGKAALTTNIDEYTKNEGYKISYTHQAIENSDLHIIPHELLFRKNMLEQDIPIFENEVWSDCQLPQKNDVFALSFYIISRLEEYYITDTDIHDRFEAHRSILFAQGLETPWIDVWSELLKEKVKKSNSTIHFPSSLYKNILTLDIDHAYLFKGKGILRQSASLAKNLLVADGNLNREWRQFMRTSIDPYDTYMYVRRKVLEYGNETYFFLLVSDYKKPYDTPIPLHSKEYQHLLMTLRSIGKIGLHPGYESHKSIEIVRKERNRLQEQIPTTLISVRQHFLKMKMPVTFQKMIDLGFTEEFSMAYATHVGFRAGTCRPFHWFDCKYNTVTTLKIVPTTCMDGTLNEYSQMSIEEAIEKVRSLKNTCRKYNGNFVSLWHNHSLSETQHWQGWRAVFEECLS